MRMIDGMAVPEHVLPDGMRTRLRVAKPASAVPVVFVSGAHGDPALSVAPLAVVIPVHRLRESPARVRAFRHVLAAVRRALRPRQIVVAEQLPPRKHRWRDYDRSGVDHVALRRQGEFCRSATINAGVRAVDADLVLILDGDVCLDWQAVREQAETLPEGTVCQPYSEVRRLPEAQTEQIYATGRTLLPKDLETTRVLGACAVLLHVSDFRAVGGFDERYVGWGVEDNAFGRTCRGLLDVVEIPRPGYHLDHGRDRPSLMATEAYRRNVEIYRNTVFPTRAAKGLALVACSWGADSAHLAATRRAVASWWQCSPRPEVCLFAVDRDARELGVFSPPAGQNARFVEMEIPKSGRGLFPKHAFWEAARLALLDMPQIDRVVFLDSHLSLAGCEECFGRVADALDAVEVVQPFELVRDDGDGTERNGAVCQWQCGRKWPGHPGYAFAATTDFLRRMGPFPAVPCAGEDAVLWNRIIPRRGNTPWIDHGPIYRRDAKYEAIIPRPACAYLPGVRLVHCSHGRTADRKYAEQNLLLTYAASRFADLAEADPGNGKSYAPRDTAQSRAFAACMGRIGSVTGSREVRDLWDGELQERMPRIDEAHPLTVVSVLRSGSIYQPRHVRWLRDQLAKHLQTPHRFVCLADCDVAGVETVPMVHKLPVTRSKLELFRADLFPDPAESVLFVDLDTVILRDFALPVCPEGEVYYIRERDRHASWTCWASGIMYFRGGGTLHRILDRFLEDRAAGLDPAWEFPGEQEFSSYCIYFERLARLRDIERLLAVRLYDNHWPSTNPPPEAHLVTWTYRVKPWDSGLSWVPPL
jgi:hypothetical protein